VCQVPSLRPEKHYHLQRTVADGAH
jgi:hypothetical protein